MRKLRGSSGMRFVSAVLMAMMATGTLGVGTAAAQNYVFYPFVVKGDPAVVTLVSYINPNVEPFFLPPEETTLHYQYLYKSPTAALNANCSPFSVPGNSSQNDVLTFDATGAFGAGQPLFNDTTSEGPFGLNLAAASPQFAYLTINDEVIHSEAGSGQGFGEAQVIDVANGTMWGYTAIEIPSGSNGNLIGGGAVLMTGTRRPVHLFPPALVTTRFAVTAMTDNLRTPAGAKFGDGNNRAALNLQLSNGPGGVYDRNENPLDGTLIVRMRCIALLGLSDLIPAATLAHPIWSVQGGWAWLSNNDRAATDADEDQLGIRYDRNTTVYKVISAGAVADAQPVVTGLCGFPEGVNSVPPPGTTFPCPGVTPEPEGSGPLPTP